MSSRLFFCYPGRLELKTGGYGYDRMLIEGLQGLGWTVDHFSLGEGFPFADRAALADAAQRLSALPDNSLAMIDGLAFGVLQDWARHEKARLRIVALVHHPLALETGLSADIALQLVRSEREALSAVRHVVVTSAETARTLAADYHVAPSAITVALPGTERKALAKGGNHPLHIVSVGTLTRRKGHDVLIEALHRIRDLSWRASIIGNDKLDPHTAEQLLNQVNTLDLSQRITLRGEVADVPRELVHGDIFALASRYEGYGMVFAEAMVQGLPIVACRAGAIPDVVPEDAGILVPPDDPRAFAAALRCLIEDEDERRRRARASATAGEALPSWEDTAWIVSDCLKRII